MKNYLLLLFLGMTLWINNVLGQNGNLVPNGGFEQYSSCPTSFGQISLAVPWDNPVGILTSTDYINTCSSNSMSLWLNGFGPNSGQGFAHIYISVYPNSPLPYSGQEYLQVPLLQPMIAGAVYKISFYGALNSSISPVVANTVGVLLTDNSVYTAGFPTVYSMQTTYNSSVPQFTISTLNSWSYYEAYYTAQGGEEVLTLGNFNTPSNIITTSPVLSTFSQSVLIDDVVIELFDTCYVHIQNSVSNDSSHLELCVGDSLEISSLTFDSTSVPTWNNSFQTQSFVTDTSGLYIVHNTWNGCNTTDTLEVDFISPPNLSLTDTSLCLGDTLTLINPDFNFTAELYTGPFLTDFGDTINVLFGQNLNYLLKKGNCEVSDNFNITLISSPTVNLPLDTLFCEGAPFTIDGTTTFADEYIWNTGSDSSSTVISDTGTYILEVNNSCGADADTLIVDLYEVDYQINFTGDTLICDASDFNVQIQGNNLSAVWNDGVDTLQRNLDEGFWWVNIYDALCSASDTINVRFPNEFTLGNDTLLCDDEVLSIHLNQSWIDSLEWSDGQVSASWSTIVPNVYWVTLYQEHCLLSDTLQLEKLYSPSMNYVDTTLCLGDQFTLFMNPEYTYEVNGIMAVAPYFIQTEGYYDIAATNYCGTSYASFQVEEVDCSCNIYVPNTFTPNGDENNPTWRPSSACIYSAYELSVYNRWGELIFRTNQPEFGWDGTYNGQMVKEGTYVYTIFYTTEENLGESLKGHVNVIR